MSQYAIELNDVSKVYRLYDRPIDRLKDSFGLSKKQTYKEYRAVDHLSFAIRKGETVGIIGSNGAGKSTTLKMITGVLSPTSGTIRIDGRISALLELGAGFNMEYTGLQNIFLNGTMIGFSKEEIERKLDSIISFADIGDYINQPVKTYSSGMFIRLAFAVAINIEPEILIVDEALSVGDVFFQSKCFKKFDEFKKAGKTVLLVSHDLSSISTYCDRVILMNAGRKMAEGEPQKMIDLYKKVVVNQVDEYGNDISAFSETESGTDMEGRMSENLHQNPDFNEYGNRKAEIIDYGLFDEQGLITSDILKGKRFTIRMKVRFHEDVAFPIFAFTIKTTKGVDVTGTNTWFEHIEVEAKKGDVKTVSFTQEMNLQGGQYLLSLGCTGYENDDFAVYHRLYEVCEITCISDKNTVGYYDMNSRIAVE